MSDPTLHPSKRDLEATERMTEATDHLAEDQQQSFTIDFGIDLGTTNSAVAVLDGTEARVITNQASATVTPSAVYIDKRGRLHVGQIARNRLGSGDDNVAVEFKLQMGRGREAARAFSHADREMLPEELSAEVLKSLRADVELQLARKMEAAVVTVPAAFDLPQCDATQRACELAGLAQSPLLQEPVAAALAYGFQVSSDREFWLVYDFGGGTFDAAVVQLRDDLLQVVNHAGDNHLGGKLIDRDLVHKLFLPALRAEHGLDLDSKDPRSRAPLAKLKLAAEEAKIAVCRSGRKQVVWLEDLCRDDAGDTIDFEYELEPAALSRIVAPYVARSLKLCHEAMAQKGLEGGHLGKVLMVGGSTLIPWVREQVAEDLGAPLEFSIDPITIVARGAAVFAGSKRLAAPPSVPVATGTYRVELEYDPVGEEVDPPLGGRVRGAGGADLAGFSIKLVETRSQWRSGKIPLSDEGTFLTDLHAERGRKNEFEITLYDPAGSVLEVQPRRFPYTVGKVITSTPLTHSVGVWMANDRVDPFLEKGTTLTARSRQIHRLAHPIEAGASGTLMRIPVVEGEHLGRADRNRLIGEIRVDAADIRRSLPAGSEVEITIEIDESRLVTAYAYVPLLDEEFKQVLTLEPDPIDLADMRGALEKERARLAKARESARRTGDLKAEEALAQIDREEMVEQVEGLLDGSEEDPDALPAAASRLLDLRAAVDEVEDALEWPDLVDTAREERKETRGIVEEYGEPDDRSKLRSRESELSLAIDSGDADLLRTRIEEMASLRHAVLFRQPGFWVGYLEYLESEADAMTDPGQAQVLFQQARQAINNNDLEALRATVRQLVGLLPQEAQQRADRKFGPSTVR